MCSKNRLSFPVQNLLARLNDALGTERIGRPRPSQRGLGFLPRFQQGFVGPFGSERGIRSVFVEELNDVEDNSCECGQRRVHVFHRSAHGISLSLNMAWGVPEQSPTIRPSRCFASEKRIISATPFLRKRTPKSISAPSAHTLCRWFWPGNISRRPFEQQFRIADCGLRISDCGFPIADCGFNPRWIGPKATSLEIEGRARLKPCRYIKSLGNNLRRCEKKSTSP